MKQSVQRMEPEAMHVVRCGGWDQRADPFSFFENKAYRVVRTRMGLHGTDKRSVQAPKGTPLL